MRFKLGTYVGVAFLVIVIGIGIVLGIILPESNPDDAFESTASLESSSSIINNENSESVDVQLALRLPAFDVVRVNKRGDAVIAGRATPGSKVTVLDGNQVIGSVIADERGEWVLLPSSPLKPGDRQLKVVQQAVDGTITESTEVVVLSIQDNIENKNETALAVLMPNDEKSASRVLQIPKVNSDIYSKHNEIKSNEDKNKVEFDIVKNESGVLIDSVDYNESGEMIIAGRSSPGSNLNVYVDEEYIGTVQADSSGRWKILPGKLLSPGKHLVRVDRLSEEGTVIARIETPLARARPEEVILGNNSFPVWEGFTPHSTSFI